MSQEKTIESARSLIADRRFADAHKVCEALLRDGTEEAEASVLSAACLLCLGCTEKEAKKQEKVRKACARAYAQAKTAEQLWHTDTRLRSAMSRYRAEQLRAGLRKQKEQASLPELKNYFDIAARYQTLPQILEAECTATLEALGASGENPEEAPEQALDQALAQEEYEVARSVFGEAKMLVRFHASGPSREVSQTLRSAIEMLTVAQVLASRSSAAAREDETRCSRLETEAEVLHFGLCSMLHPDGQSLSLYCSGREEMIDQLRKLYGEIAALRPDFRAPEIPSAESVNTVPQKPRKPGRFGKHKT